MKSPRVFLFLSLIVVMGFVGCDDESSSNNNNIDPCENISCGVEAFCNPDTGYCECNVGFSGNATETEGCVADSTDLCANVSCGGFAECGSDDGFCYCIEGYAGSDATGVGCDELLVVIVIESGTRLVNSLDISYELLSLKLGEKDTTYAFFAVPTSTSTKIPAVLYTKPYDVIDWTGEQVDIDQATQSATTTLETMLESAFVYNYNNIAYLEAFGRFYTGESIENDVNDMVSALKYLGEHNLVDSDNIGIWGGSWGGFEALYGAAYAKDDSVPAVGVALFPVSDFEAMVNHVNSIPSVVTNPDKIAEYETFFAPYMERIYLTTGGAPDATGSDYSGYTLDTMLPELTTPFMVWHENHDTLVSFDQTVQLAAAASDLIEPLYYYHATPLDMETEPLGHGVMFDSVLTLSFSYMFTSIVKPGQTITLLYYPADFTLMMTYFRDLESMGIDSSFVVPILQTLTDSRILMFSGAAPVPTGNEVLADAFNSLWCLAPTISATDVPAMLETIGLPTSACK
jgi:pimeloyl-ACP methyl ester carboxylesterase